MTLIKKWGISTDIANKTLQVTTQSGIRTVFYLYLSQRFRMKDRALWYRRLPHNVFEDTLFAVITSKRGKKYAELFENNFGWARAFTMKRKSEDH